MSSDHDRYYTIYKHIEILLYTDCCVHVYMIVKRGHVVTRILNTALGGRTKREFKAKNLRRDWISDSRVIVSWDHPTSHSRVISYKLVHVSINVADGEPNLKYHFLSLDQTQTHVTIDNVSIHDFHLFNLDTIHQNFTVGEILLDGKYYTEPVIDIDCTHHII